MDSTKINLRYEQQSTLRRSHYTYSTMARIFIFSMNLVTGKKITLSKVKLLELLASIPYREWEIRQYANCTKKFRDTHAIPKFIRIVRWSRAAQDNEYWHLQVVQEKMKKEGMKDAWYLSWFFRTFMIMFYVLLAKISALFNIKWAYFFNAQFEDHAEHAYAQLVVDHPEWENQRVHSHIVGMRGKYDTWADVFRRICLDERDHRNASFFYIGQIKYIEEYEGMPDF